MDRLKEYNKKTYAWVTMVLAPLFVLLFMLVFFKLNGLYPFGTRSISWCDMDQQVVPLLLQFKDILSGKEGFFLSVKNAGGMNFFGVFFFFLASPFSLLVAFVDKADMLSFMNVLVMLKMSMMAFTSSVYFSHREKVDLPVAVTLSVLYAFSGYVMLYYQNVIWLDVAYLFPVLLLSLEKLKEGKKALYVFTLTLSMAVNYYIGYMLVVFLLLYAFTEVLFGIKKDKYDAFAKNFIIASLLSALLSAVVWAPSLLQYFSSGRTSDIIRNISKSAFGTSYQTTYPTIFSVLFLLPFAFFGTRKSKNYAVRAVLLVLTLIPVFIEPVNKMWQTGSYMSFPTRYAFMTIFLCLSLAYDGITLPSPICFAPIISAKTAKKRTFESKDEKGDSVPKAPINVPYAWILSAVALLLSVGFIAFSFVYTSKNAQTMGHYARSLWGNDESFFALIKLYAVMFGVGMVWFLLHKTGKAKPALLALGMVALVLSETYVAPTVYMLTPSHEPDWFKEVVDMGEKVDYDGFFRVKTDRDYSYHDFDANMMGGIGYNAIGHYTSLTDTDYMTAIKEWGYTSYWMEVGNSGGTVLSDALLSVKFEISRKSLAGELYQNTYFHVRERAEFLDLGIIARGDLIERESARQTGTFRPRGEMQQTLYNDFFASDNGVEVFTLDDFELTDVGVQKLSNGKTKLTPLSADAKLVFRKPASSSSKYYFNVFDENTNALRQGINGKFSVRSSYTSYSSFPTSKDNGLLYVGDFASSPLVTIGLLATTSVSDFSMIAVSKEKLSLGIERARTLSMTVKNNTVKGSYHTSTGGQSVFLSIPYNKGMRLTINGKRAELFRVYDGFTAFYLEKGDNEIAITFRPQGFTIGVALSVLGTLSTVIVLFVIDRKNRNVITGKALFVANIGVLALGVFVLVAVYIAPILLCLIN